MQLLLYKLAFVMGVAVGLAAGFQHGYAEGIREGEAAAAESSKCFNSLHFPILLH